MSPWPPPRPPWGPPGHPGPPGPDWHRQWRRHHRQHWRRWHQWRMSRLGHFVRARLRRRLFMWFAATILATGMVVAVVMNLTGGTAWRQELERFNTFAGNRFAEVWDVPAQREALVRGIVTDLGVDLELTDTSGQMVARGGEACRRPDLTVPVMRDEARLGTARLCYRRTRPHQAWRGVLPLVLAVGVLWTAAGVVSRRLARPVDALVRATQELGAGKLNARASLDWHATGEFTVLAESFNDMAARIEKQMADQRELLAAVSHELRTPLARLRVLTELLRDGGGNPRTLDQVDREVVELDALVGELLASSRLDFGQLTPKVLDGKELAARALERAGLPAEKLAVEADGSGLVGDATLLGRALVNLLDNARRHGGGAESLRLMARDDEHLVFCVDDRGPGLQPGEEVRIFQPFYRKDRGGEAREAGSLGLGLALVQRIARAHGGEAFAENRPDGGARVGFTVRKAGPPSKAEQPVA